MKNNDAFLIPSFLAVQSWINRHPRGLLLLQMTVFRLHRWFWHFWSVSLASVAFTHKQASHAHAALAVAFGIEVLVMVCDTQEKKAHKKWLEL